MKSPRLSVNKFPIWSQSWQSEIDQISSMLVLKRHINDLTLTLWNSEVDIFTRTVAAGEFTPGEGTVARKLCFVRLETTYCHKPSMKQPLTADWLLFRPSVRLCGSVFFDSKGWKGLYWANVNQLPCCSGIYSNYKVAHGFTILAKDCKNLYESLNSSWISCLQYHPLLANVI